MKTGKKMITHLQKIKEQYGQTYVELRPGVSCLVSGILDRMITHLEDEEQNFEHKCQCEKNALSIQFSARGLKLPTLEEVKAQYKREEI